MRRVPAKPRPAESERPTAPVVEVVKGDCREVLAGLPEHAFDSCVCDPPYDLTGASRGGSPRRPGNGPAGRHRVGEGGFMGKTWDATGVAFDPETWHAVLRVLKPGAHLAAFGGTRTHHRLMVALEDAGFEIRDVLMWVYGQGFPKSLDVSKAIDKEAGAERKVIGLSRHKPGLVKGSSDHYTVGGTKAERVEITAPATPEAARWQGWGTALKPAWEPIILARKPLSERSVAANVLRWGTGAINVDGCRVEAALGDYEHHIGHIQAHEGFEGKSFKMPERDMTPAHLAGRWPANVVLSHDPRCVVVGAERDPGFARNTFKDGAKPFGGGAGHEYESERVEGGEREVWACVPGCPVRMMDEQSGQMTSSYRKGNRASKKQGSVSFSPSRENGGTRCNAGHHDSGGASRFFYCAKTSTNERSVGLPLSRRNLHPTVKPVALMRWLARLVTPPGGRVVDPFAGSGSTLVACALEGLGALGIELDADGDDHVGTARLRVAAAERHGEGYARLRVMKIRRLTPKLRVRKARGKA